jgi:hypothetical protein
MRNSIIHHCLVFPPNRSAVQIVVGRHDTWTQTENFAKETVGESHDLVNVFINTSNVMTEITVNNKQSITFN